MPSAFKHYYEPFVGGGALFFTLRSSGWRGAATLGDSNLLLICTYLGVRNDVEAVIDGLNDEVYSEAAFLEARARQPQADWPDDEIAVWFIYMNKSCFNGLWRVNAKGVFNVPFGRYDNPTLCDAEGLRAASAALARTKLLGCDFEGAVRSAEKGDFVYFDPPYVPVSATADFTSYTRGGFALADQTRLRDCAWKLRERGVHVMLSNADVAIVRELYRKFDVRRVEARRAVNSDASKRGKGGEVIIT